MSNCQSPRHQLPLRSIILQFRVLWSSFFDGWRFALCLNTLFFPAEIHGAFAPDFLYVPPYFLVSFHLPPFSRFRMKLYPSWRPPAPPTDFRTPLLGFPIGFSCLFFVEIAPLHPAFAFPKVKRPAPRFGFSILSKHWKTKPFTKLTHFLF